MANKNRKVLQAVSYIYEHMYHSPQRPVGEWCMSMYVFGSAEIAALCTVLPASTKFKIPVLYLCVSI